MNNQPKISIMTLAYNCEDFLADTLESATNQAFNNWELIIIDDHSTDNTPKIAKQFTAYDERIKYFRNEENLGIPKSRNRALEESQGEYIAVLDGDDVWLDKDKLKKQVEFLDENPDYGVVGTWTNNINADGEVVGQNETATENQTIKKTMYLKNQIVNSSSLFRIKAARDHGGYANNFHQSEDMELWLAIGRNWKLANLPTFATGYRTHGQNASLEKRKTQLHFNIAAMKKHREFYPLGAYLWLLVLLKKLYITLEPLIRPIICQARRLFSW